MERRRGDAGGGMGLMKLQSQLVTTAPRTSPRREQLQRRPALVKSCRGWRTYVGLRAAFGYPLQLRRDVSCRLPAVIGDPC